MNSTEPVIKQSRHTGSPASATEWLDALSSGACDQEAFFSGVSDLLQETPDTGWDLLAFLDQYYRRGKISAAAFTAVNARLQGLVMRKRPDEDSSVPLPGLLEPMELTSAPPQGAPDGAQPKIAAAVPASAGAAQAKVAAAVRPGAPAPAQPVVSATVPAQAAAAAPGPAPDRTLSDPARGRSPRTIAVGDVLRNRYRVLGVLGQGGMGTVFSAVDQYRLDGPHGDPLVAVKVLHTEVMMRPRLFAELRREFQYLQSLSHPNIVRVHEFDRDGDLAFFTMEHLSGVLLSRVLSAHESAALHRPHAFAFIRDIGAAVAYAHARGVVHGDLYPGNIFVTDGGEVRVLDFGASHRLHRAPWISEFDNARQLPVATPKYASCQLLEGEVAEARDDVYALACIAYVLLTGSHPFHDNTALKARTLRMTPDRPSGLGKRQWNTLRAGLHFDRERRPSDVQEWLEGLALPGAATQLPALPSILTARPRRRQSMRWPAAAALLILAACGWWVFATVGSSDRAMGSAVSVIAAAAGRFKSVFAHTVIGDWWDNSHGRGDAKAVDAPPAPDTGELRHSPPEPSAAPSESPAAPPTGAARNEAETSSPAVGAAQNGNPQPHAQIELAADSVEVPPAEPVAQVTVRRSRNLRGEVSFNWWTESGTAKPGRDFVPASSRVEHIANGKSSASLFIPIMTDPARNQPRSFYVVIDQAVEGAAVGPRTLTMVTIPAGQGTAER
ncbi:MAG: protein kinase [Pseudomonadota bacterium]|nr:protein kinase [Pseudomonadota bacterium]